MERDKGEGWIEILRQVRLDEERSLSFFGDEKDDKGFWEVYEVFKSTAKESGVGVEWLVGQKMGEFTRQFPNWKFGERYGVGGSELREGLREKEDELNSTEVSSQWIEEFLE